MKIYKVPNKQLANGTLQPQHSEVDRKTINWSSCFDEFNSMFYFGKRQPDPIEVIKYIQEKNKECEFEDEDKELKENIDNTCTKLTSMFRGTDNNELHKMFYLIKLGEFLFSSNNQHLDILLELGSKSLENDLRKNKGELNCDKSKRNREIEKLTIEVYKELKNEGAKEYGIKTKVVHRLRTNHNIEALADTVYTQIKKYKKSSDS